MNHVRLANYFMKPQASHKKGQESDSELSADVFCVPNFWHPEAQHGGLKSDADRAACLQTLAVLVGEAAGGDEVTGSISVSMDAEFDDFGFTVGPNLCLIRMTHKQVDLNDVYGCSNALARALKKHLKGQGTVDLLDLLKAVLSKGAFMWFAKQVIWWFGKLVDLMIMKRTSESRLADMTRDMGDRCLTRYWLAMRRSFDQTQWLSLGVDCGRIGKKNFWVGLAATPGNLGVVIPPLETMLPKKIPSTLLVVFLFSGGNPACGCCDFSRHSEKHLAQPKDTCQDFVWETHRDTCQVFSNHVWETHRDYSEHVLVSVWCLISLGWVQLNGLSPQEQREHYADADLAADTKDAAGVSEAKATWMEKARCWLKRKKQLDDTAEAKRPKKFRKKSYMWLVSLNTTLVNVTGRSIEAYCHDEDGDGPSGVSPPAAMWPYLAISADQGPDGLCASFFLAYHCKANVEFFWDPSHGYQRYIIGATGMVGLSAFMHLMVITYNLGHGPWDSHARYAQLCESTTSYLQHHVHQCPLFHFYKMQIAKEFGLLEFSGQALADADIIEAMKDHWSMKQKGAKVHLCRFGAFTTKAAEFDGHHTFTLLRCLHLGLTEGMFSKAVLDILLKPVKLEAPSETAEKTPVARSNDAHQKLRHLCNNNIAVAAVMLSDYRTGFRTKVLYKLADPVCRWYKHQSSKIRSTAEAASWLAQQVKGDIWIPLQATWKQLLDQQLLEQLGLDITFFPGMHQLDEGHPVVGENEEIADLAGRYIISLVALRDRRLQFYTEGWQGKQTMLFSGDPAVQSQAVRDLQEQHLAFEALKLRTDSVSRNMVRRSIFQLAPIQQLVSLCAESGWAPSEQLAQHCKNRVSSVLQSKCAEDIINKGRSLERPAPNQSQLPARRVWKNLIDEGVVDKLYRYKSPSGGMWQCLEVKQADCQRRFSSRASMTRPRRSRQLWGSHRSPHGFRQGLLPCTWPMLTCM